MSCAVCGTYLVMQLFSLHVFATNACQLYNKNENSTLKLTYVALEAHKKLGEPVVLKCRAINFCEITWFHLHDVILPSKEYKLSNQNQTLEIKNLQERLTGNYSCVATDGVRSMTGAGSTGVQIRKTQYIDPFLFRPTDLCQNRTVEIGDSYVIQCIAVSGATPVFFFPFWQRLNETATAQTGNMTWGFASMFDYGNAEVIFTNVNIPINESHKGITFVMNVTNSSHEVYGTYAATVIINNTPSKQIIVISPPDNLALIKKLLAVLLPLASVVLIVVIMVLLWREYHLDIRLYAKKKISKEVKDDKLYDVYISYGEADVGDPFIFCSLRQSLLRRGYRVFIRDFDIHPGSCFLEEVNIAVRNSRSLILIVTPEYLTSRIAALELQAFSSIAPSLDHPVIPIILKDISKSLKSASPLCIKFMSNKPIVLSEDEMKDEFFSSCKSFKRLCLQLPVVQVKGEVEINHNRNKNLIECEVLPHIEPAEG